MLEKKEDFGLKRGWLWLAANPSEGKATPRCLKTKKSMKQDAKKINKKGLWLVQGPGSSTSRANNDSTGKAECAKSICMYDVPFCQLNCMW